LSKAWYTNLYPPDQWFMTVLLDGTWVGYTDAVVTH
jgi:hypothetical protein